MFRLILSKSLRLIPVVCLFFAGRAFAQFEVAPDHFDSTPNQEVRKDATKKNAKVTLPAKPLASAGVAAHSNATSTHRNGSTNHSAIVAAPASVPKQGATQAPGAQAVAREKSVKPSPATVHTAKAAPPVNQRQ